MLTAAAGEPERISRRTSGRRLSGTIEQGKVNAQIKNPNSKKEKAYNIVRVIKCTGKASDTQILPIKAKISQLNTKNKNTAKASRILKQIATEEDNASEIPQEATVLSTSTPPPSVEVNPFLAAKRAFHRSGSFKIVGRIEEKAELTSFWYENVLAGRGASIYISGNPGTGKTALVDELLTELASEAATTNAKVKVIKINCMMLKDPLRAFHELATSLNVPLLPQDRNPLIILNALESFFTSLDHTVVIVIDEVDQIGMKDPELLCKLLAMPYLKGARVCVIGIANSMDLTERFLPRLKLLNCSPSVLHFPQYTVADISSILCDRLERINNEGCCCLIDRSAIELTARKVASTGDLRRALDILRQAIDLAEEEYKLKAKDSVNSTSLVKISHVVSIMDKFGNSQSSPLLLLKSLNLHQKVLLAALIGAQMTNSTQSISSTPTTVVSTKATILTIQKVYEDYCRGSTLPPKLYDSVTRSEFIDLISNLESMNIIGKSSSSTTSETDQWKMKLFLQIPNELVKTMIAQELPTIKVLFGL